MGEIDKESLKGSIVYFCERGMNLRPALPFGKLDCVSNLVDLELESCAGFEERQGEPGKGRV